MKRGGINIRRLFVPLILGLEGLTPTKAECELFARVRPAGFILFKRNVQNRAQLSALTSRLRHIINSHDAPILIDQEGGRVARLRGDEWYKAPASSYISDADQARLNAQRIARDLRSIGVNFNCAPVLDLIYDGASDVIGDRAFSRYPEVVARLGLASAEGMLSEGVTPIIKHIPGHGRATIDSHAALPTVTASVEELRSTDFMPFLMLNNMPWAMAAHVVYQAIDPMAPATHSAKVVHLIRSELRFAGILITDCITMNALTGSMSQRALKAIEAGFDLVLYSGFDVGAIEEMAKVLPQRTIDLHACHVLAQDVCSSGQIVDPISD